MLLPLLILATVPWINAETFSLEPLMESLVPIANSVLRMDDSAKENLEAFSLGSNLMKELVQIPKIINTAIKGVSVIQGAANSIFDIIYKDMKIRNPPPPTITINNNEIRPYIAISDELDSDLGTILRILNSMKITFDKKLLPQVIQELDNFYYNLRLPTDEVNEFINDLNQLIALVKKIGTYFANAAELSKRAVKKGDGPPTRIVMTVINNVITSFAQNLIKIANDSHKVMIHLPIDQLDSRTDKITGKVILVKLNGVLQEFDKLLVKLHFFLDQSSKLLNFLLSKEMKPLLIELFDST